MSQSDAWETICSFFLVGRAYSGCQFLTPSCNPTHDVFGGRAEVDRIMHVPRRTHVCSRLRLRVGSDTAANADLPPFYGRLKLLLLGRWQYDRTLGRMHFLECALRLHIYRLHICIYSSIMIHISPSPLYFNNPSSLTLFQQSERQVHDQPRSSSG